MGGDTYTMSNILPTCLKGNVLAWLRNQTAGSICSYGYFHNIFIETFSTPQDASELKKDFKNILMKEGEQLCDFVQRFKLQLNIVPNISPTDIIEIFKMTVRNEQ